MAAWERTGDLPGWQLARAVSHRAGRPSWLDGFEDGPVRRVRERSAKLLAVADVELAEHLVQVVLDRPRADEELRADLRVGASIAGQSRHLDLLRRERVARLRGHTTDGLAGGEQLAAGAFGERAGPHLAEALVGRAQDLAPVRAPVLTP